MARGRKDALTMIERAMVRIRRSQTRRAISRLMEQETGQRFVVSHTFVVDALEQAAEEGDKEPTVGAVAERLGIDPSRASRMVADAVKAGFVRRVASQRDGRRSLLRLTRKGFKCARDARELRTAYFARLVQDWTDRECRDFARLLTKFTEPRTGRARRRRLMPRRK